MLNPLEILERAGMPDGAARPAPSQLLPGIREAVCELDATAADLPARSIEPLLSWLRAFESHWPARFNAELGDAGRNLIVQLESRSPDPNRYLKLRRIALENLAAVL